MTGHPPNGGPGPESEGEEFAGCSAHTHTFGLNLLCEHNSIQMKTSSGKEAIIRHAREQHALNHSEPEANAA